MQLPYEERKILLYLAREYTILQIVNRERVNRRTIERIIGRLYTLLNVHSAVGAVAQAFALGILVPEDVPIKVTSKAASVPYQQLTPREREALSWCTWSLSARDIGARMGLTPNSVQKYHEAARRKLFVETNEEAVEVAYMRGQLDQTIAKER